MSHTDESWPTRAHIGRQSGPRQVPRSDPQGCAVNWCKNKRAKRTSPRSWQSQRRPGQSVPRKSTRSQCSAACMTISCECEPCAVVREHQRMDKAKDNTGRPIDGEHSHDAERRSIHCSPKISAMASGAISARPAKAGNETKRGEFHEPAKRHAKPFRIVSKA